MSFTLLAKAKSKTGSRPALTILLLGLSLFGSNLAEAQCMTKPLRSEDLTEAGIKKFVDLYASQNLKFDDFACCLPQVFRKNYLVVHSSLAAQDSIPESPRVIMTNFVFNDAGISKPPTAFFSMNGGHKSLRQTESYETALVDPKTGRVNYYDINFSSGKPVMIGPNPQLCMACHGTNGQIGSSGPHLIFDGPDIWPRFVKGGDFLSPVDGTPPPEWLTSYLTSLSDASESALKTNPRFKCLAKDVPTVAFQNELDHMIDKLNRTRITEEIRKTKDFEKFKFAIAGAETCPTLLEDLDCQLSGDETKSCRSWFSPQAIREMTNDSTLTGEIRGAKNSAQLNSTALAIFDRRRAAIRRNVDEAMKSPKKERINFELRGRIIQPRASVLSDRESNLKSLLLKKYFADTVLHGGSVNPLTRFLFETRGIETASWGTNIVAGYQRESVGIYELMSAEGHKGQLKSVMDGPGSSCDLLRAASLRATGGNAGPNGGAYTDQ